MRYLSCTAVLLMLAAPPQSEAADAHWQFGSAPSVSSGFYGSDTRTTVVHTPLTVRRLFDAGDLTVVLPLLCVNGDAFVAIVNGSPVVANSGGRPTGTARNPSGRTGAPSQGPTPPAPVTTNECGLGDVVVRGRYYAIDERGWLPTLAVRAHVKVPTADAQRGLGTGRADEGFGVELSRTIASDVLLMADGGFTLVGDPTGDTYDNSVWYDIGVGRDLANGSLNVSVFFEEERAIVPGLANPRDLLAALSVKGPGSWRVQASSIFGLSNGAPDFGFVLGFSRRF